MGPRLTDITKTNTDSYVVKTGSFSPEAALGESKKAADSAGIGKLAGQFIRRRQRPPVRRGGDTVARQAVSTTGLQVRGFNADAAAGPIELAFKLREVARQAGTPHSESPSSASISSAKASADDLEIPVSESH
jgi:hypothetical protein